MSELNEQKLNEFIGKMLGDLGGAISVPTVRIGFRLGLFDALHEGGPATAAELADAQAAWPNAMCASGRWPRPPTATSTTTPPSAAFSLSPEQAMVFAVKDSPVYLAGAFDMAAAMIEGEPKVEARFPHRRGRALGRLGRLPVLRHRRLLPSGLRQQHRPVLAAGARRRGRRSWRRAPRSPTSAAASASRPC